MKRPRQRKAAEPRPDVIEPARVRRQHREGPTAVVRGEWRDPDDANPNRRAAREISGYRTFDALRAMAARSGTSVTERHVFAADRLRLAIDGAEIGFTWHDRDLLPVIDRVFGPVGGPSRLATRQAQAVREVQRVAALYTAGQFRMLVSVAVENHTLAAWCRERDPPINLNVAMGMLIYTLDMLEQHYAAEIDEDIQRGRTAA